MLHDEGLDDYVCRVLHLAEHEPDLTEWRALVAAGRGRRPTVRIGLVGKYVNLPDAYLSVVEALQARRLRAAAPRSRSTGSRPTTPRACSPRAASRDLDGIVVPGGFGFRGIEGKIAAAGFAREHEVPFLGLCLGLQCAVIEFARDVCGLAGANSSEFDPHTPHPVIDLMDEQRDVVDKGGTMRLGAYPAKLAAGLDRARGLRRGGRLRAPPAPLRGEQPYRAPARGGRAASARAPRPTTGWSSSSSCPVDAPVLRGDAGPPGVQEPARPAAPAVRGVRARRRGRGPKGACRACRSSPSPSTQRDATAPLTGPAHVTGFRVVGSETRRATPGSSTIAEERVDGARRRGVRPRIVVRHPGAVVVVPVDRRRRRRCSCASTASRIGARAARGARRASATSTASRPRRPPRASSRRRSGYRPGRLVKLAEFYNSPGFCDEYTHLFLALDLEDLGATRRGRAPRRRR